MDFGLSKINLLLFNVFPLKNLIFFVEPRNTGF